MLYATDAEKGEGVELAKTHAVRGYPTFLLVDAQGQPIDRWIGYGKTYFLDALKEALADPLPLEAKRARFATTPNARDGAALGRYHSSRMECAEAVRFYREAQRLNQDPQHDYTNDIFECVARGLMDTTFTMSDLRQAADDVMSSPKSTAADRLTAAGMVLQIGMARGDTALAVAYLERAVEGAAGSSDPQEQTTRKELLAEHALYVLRDVGQAIAFKKSSLPAGWEERAADLNSIAWWCVEKRINLPEAEGLARKGVELAAPGKEKAMVLDTLAEICALRGSIAEAIGLTRQAIEQDPASKYYPKQLERFMQMAAQS